MRWFLVTLVTLTSITSCMGSRVLFLAPIALKSHTQFFTGIAKGLVDAGHEVTLVIPMSRGVPGVREVIVNVTDLGSQILDPFKNGRFATQRIVDLWAPLCLEAMEQKEIQDLRKEKFDIVILSNSHNDCLLAYIHEMKVPYIWAIVTGFTVTMQSELAGSPYFPSFTPNLLSAGVADPKGLPFYHRFVGVLTDLYSLNIFHNGVKKVDRECRAAGLCPADMPPLMELRYNASLVIINSIRNNEPVATPYTPAVIHAGGAHLRPAQPLPVDLEKWVEDSGEHGFILFSMGTVVKPSEMPEHALRPILNVLGSLKQRVLWKWDQDNMDNLPSNIRLTKWLPQQDILGHKKLRFFITHGGIASTQEAAYHGCPVISIPVFFDQFMNVNQVQNQGWGRTIYWDNFTEESLREAIEDILSSNRMRNIARQRSAVMRDQQRSPQENVNFWVEYVLRHNGAEHLRSPLLKMPWYRLFNIDVWLCLIVAVVLLMTILVYVTYRILKAIWRLITRPWKLKNE